VHQGHRRSSMVGHGLTWVLMLLSLEDHVSSSGMTPWEYTSQVDLTGACYVASCF
jgi:hypothetical protein